MVQQEWPDSQEMSACMKLLSLVWGFDTTLTLWVSLSTAPLSITDLAFFFTP